MFAESLGEILNQPLYELKAELTKKSFIPFMFKAIQGEFSGKGCPITNMPETISAEIYLCTPVWAGSISGPARYFLDNANLKNTVVNLLLTASVPVEKYTQDALEYLNKIPCKPNNAYIFATKTKPDRDIINEHLKEMLGL